MQVHKIFPKKQRNIPQRAFKNCTIANNLNNLKEENWIKVNV